MRIRTRQRRGTRFVAVGLALALAVAACGGGDDAADDDDAGDTEEEVDGAADDESASEGEGESSSGDGDAVSLRVAWSGSDDRTRRTQEAIDLFVSENPDIAVSFEFTTSTGFWDRMTTQVAGGNAPDIVQMSGQILAQYAVEGALLGLDDYTGEQIDISDWEPELLERQTVDGVLYGIPPGVDAHAIIYDATKLEELGIDAPSETWTWSEYADLTRQISEAAGEDYWGSEDGGLQYEVFQTFLAQREKRLFNDDGSIGWDRQDLIDFWGFFGELQEEGVLVPPDILQEFGRNPENSGPIQDYAVFSWSTSSQYMNFVNLTERDIQLANYPFSDESDISGQVWRGGLAWSITSSSQHPEEAARLIDFLVNNEEAGEILGTSRGVPGSPVIREQVREQSDEIEQRVFDQLADVQGYGAEITPLFPVGWTDFNNAFQRVYDEYARGLLSLEDAVDQFIDEANTAIG